MLRNHSSEHQKQTKHCNYCGANYLRNALLWTEGSPAPADNLRVWLSFGDDWRFLGSLVRFADPNMLVRQDYDFEY